MLTADQKKSICGNKCWITIPVSNNCGGSITVACDSCPPNSGYNCCNTNTHICSSYIDYIMPVSIRRGRLIDRSWYSVFYADNCSATTPNSFQMCGTQYYDRNRAQFVTGNLVNLTKGSLVEDCPNTTDDVFSYTYGCRASRCQ